ncbi:MAG: hypothetical protein JJLCMIEE_02756 [Acidimicrobiales bacterium]|nr:MAG: ABC transporter substrate-binding protein [Actinomycetota bacterium]MBV6509660.1 hypothetical protein [Acidimicrobiales bacterium]RIK06351.1 MAG: hypothetical protein DCC48_07975 [Acidobacteriota bacterium]
MYRRVAILAVVAVLALAACTTTKDENTDDDGGGPAGESGESGETGEQERTTRGVTDSSVTVGGILYGLNFGGADVGAAARFDRANAEGGVHGRTIEFLGAADDNSDSSASLAEAQRLVRQEGVFAIVPVTTASLSADFMIDENVPFFGWGISPAFCGNEVGFGFTGCVTDPELERGSNAFGVVLAEHFDGDTDKSVALIAEDNDAGEGGLRLLSSSVEDQGFEVVYSEAAIPAPPATVGDYTPFVNELLTSNEGEPPDVIMLTVSVANVVGLSDALQGVYDGLVVSPFYDPRLVSNPAFEGQAILTQILPYEYADENALLGQMVDDIEAYDEANGTDTQLTLAVAAGYWSADQFLALLEETGEDLTVENFLAAQEGWEYEVEGVVGKSSWPQNHDSPVPCAAFSIVEDGAYLPDIALTCGEVIEIPE